MGRVEELEKELGESKVRTEASRARGEALMFPPRIYSRPSFSSSSSSLGFLEGKEERGPSNPIVRGFLDEFSNSDMSQESFKGIAKKYMKKMASGQGIPYATSSKILARAAKHYLSTGDLSYDE